MLYTIIKLVILVPIMYFIMGCAATTTDNPTTPEADSPIVFGEQTPAPWGCVKWQKTTDIKGVWSVESKCCPLEKEEEDWKLKGWDC